MRIMPRLEPYLPLMSNFGRPILVVLLAALAALLPGMEPAGVARAAQAAHGIAMHGEPDLPPTFQHFPYVNPEAPKGGRLAFAVPGTFDSLNPFIVRGVPFLAVRGYVVESLLARSYDEPFSLYGLLAETVETDDARTYATFTLNPAARFSDGRPVTADDVIFSWQLLRDKGRPNHRTYYAKVTKAVRLGDRAVRFEFGDGGDRELPLILGLMPILAKHAVDPNTFENTSLTPLLGSGPYRVAEVKPGERVSLRRDPNYWGRDLPVNRGQWNFDEVRYDYYRDANTQFEAFKKGLVDIRPERDPGRWHTAYDFPAVRDGRVVKETFVSRHPHGMLAFVFNTRRPIFADVRVREALGLLFDFEWVNRNFFYNLYARTGSFFQGSELAALGRPADAAERALLARYPGAVREDVLEGTWGPPTTDGSGRDRDTLRRALTLLEQAGWTLRDGRLRHRETDRPFTFEILVVTKDQERLALAYARDLNRAGIKAEIRVADAVQFERRRQDFDFDMIQYEWSSSLSPGNEQSFYWSSRAADEPGSRNYMGVKSEAIDGLIETMLAARSRADFVTAVRALDRVLMSGFYVVPLFHPPRQWVARWSRIEHPQTTSLFGYLPETWWQQPHTQ